MIRAGARARAHTQGGGERRDKVGEGTDTGRHTRRREGKKWLNERSGYGIHFF